MNQSDLLESHFIEIFIALLVLPILYGVINRINLAVIAKKARTKMSREDTALELGVTRKQKELNFFMKYYDIKSPHLSRIYPIKGIGRILYKTPFHMHHRIPDRYFIGTREICGKDRFIAAFKEHEENWGEMIILDNTKAALIALNGIVFLSRETLERCKDYSSIVENPIIVEDEFYPSTFWDRLHWGDCKRSIQVLFWSLLSFTFCSVILLIPMSLIGGGMLITRISDYVDEKKEIREQLDFNPVVYKDTKAFRDSNPEIGDEILIDSVRLVPSYSIPYYSENGYSLQTLLINADYPYSLDFSSLKKRIQAYELINKSILGEAYWYKRVRFVEDWNYWLSESNRKELLQVFSDDPEFSQLMDLLDQGRGSFSKEILETYGNFVRKENKMFEILLDQILWDASGEKSIYMTNGNFDGCIDFNARFWSFCKGEIDSTSLINAFDTLERQAKESRDVSGIIQEITYFDDTPHGKRMMVILLKELKPNTTSSPSL